MKQVIAKEGLWSDPPSIPPWLIFGVLSVEKVPEQFRNGQREIYPEDIARFLIFSPPEGFQQQIADLVQQSYRARQKVKALLEEAKTKVTAVIEGRED